MTTPWRTQTITGWGRNAASTTLTARPERLSQLTPLTLENGRILALGMGRSYGDVGVPGSHARAVDLSQLDRLISFDAESGVVVAEAGVRLIDLLHIFLPRGFVVAVAPGTSLVSIGGAIANDVHAKNHRIEGSFGAHVLWIDLLLPSGEERRVSREQDPHIFYATLGGIGLTGIIVRAAIRLKKVPGRAVCVTQHRVENLDDMMSSLESLPPQDEYAMAWLDALARGASMGRGIFERAHYTAVQAPLPKATAPSVPFDFPSLALNPLSIRMFNILRYHMVGHAHPTQQVVAAETFFYPLDKIGHWNRMYGKRGFHQFQVVIPIAEAGRGIPMLLEKISRSGHASFLAVLKRLGAEGEGYLSFPMPGFTLALDFPNRRTTPEMLASLIRIARDHGGRVYTAKDSAATPDDFAAMYPRLPQFKQVLEQIDPAGRMCSRMAERLGLRSAI